MQALWRTLRNTNDQIAHVAFRVLGKFGGGNRKMMIEAQALEYKDTDDSDGPKFTIYFPEHKGKNKEIFNGHFFSENSHFPKITEQKNRTFNF